jgi:anti-anti-sigma factor
VRVAITRTGRHRLLLEFMGDLDADAAEQLERKLFLPRQARLDLDLSGLDFVDVPGMRFLVMITQKRGGKAEVVACSSAARRALELSGLGRSIPVTG